jgi:hypothetical protein
MLERHTCALFPDEQVIDLGTWDAGHHRESGPTERSTDERNADPATGVPVR